MMFFWHCVRSVCIVAIFAYLAVHFESLWIILIALLFSADYSRSKGNKE